MAVVEVGVDVEEGAVFVGEVLVGIGGLCDAARFAV